MRNRRLLIVAAIVVVLVVGGGIIAFRGAGGGGETRNLTLTVSNQKMSPEKITVKQGDTVNLTVIKDTDEEVHLHGYDIHFEGKAGTKVTKNFKADKSGSFEIELEQTSTHLGDLDVT